MIKNTLIICLVIVLIYLYYQQKQQPKFTTGASEPDSSFTSFLKDHLNSNSLEELKTKLDSKTLNELLEENEDYETEVDTLTRSKNSLEQDLRVQGESFQSRLREKDREIKKLKEDLAEEKKRLKKSQENLTSEKQQHKGSLERITKLTEQITNLEKEQQKLKEQLKKDKTKEHQEQLRKIYALFDLRAQGMKEIDFNQLMNMLKGVKEKAGKK